jgi:hypothetical protein
MKPVSGPHETNLKRTAALFFEGAELLSLEIHMSAAIARLLPRASATLVADLDTLVSTAIFCGIGLFLSLSVLILDQNITGEWF